MTPLFGTPRSGQLTAGIVLTAVALIAPTASAQVQQVCFDDSIALTPTNWVNQTLTVSKFDPDLGILTGIDFELAGTTEGSAGIESLDATPTTVVTSFQATLTLQRPDMSVIVVTIPAAMFSDDLTAFDGIIDFGGTSGITHAGIQTMATETASSPPPASDLALFTGPAGNPGTIVLPIEGVGSSSAAGSGNLITQFMTSASCELTVCYTYELDCNDNGIPDDQDIADGTSEDCNSNGIPDECEDDPGFLYCPGVGCPCGNDDPMAGCANSTGSGALLTGAGTSSIAADDLLMVGSNLIPGEQAMLFSADETLNGCNGRAFGDGLRCAGVNSLRLQAMVPGPAGDALYGPGLLSLEDDPQPGDDRRYQIWYRDMNGPCLSGFNLSNAFSVTYTP